MRLGSLQVTTGDLIIGFLLSCNNSSTMRTVIYERVKDRDRKSVEKAISQMLKEGIMVKDKDMLKLSNKGKTLAQVRSLYTLQQSPFTKDAKKDTLVLFDIPEYKRKTRNWLRLQLGMFGYVMVQKSVWKGPGPLPKDFLNKLVEMNIKKSVIIFKINSSPRK